MPVYSHDPSKPRGSSSRKCLFKDCICGSLGTTQKAQCLDESKMMQCAVRKRKGSGLTGTVTACDAGMKVLCWDSSSRSPPAAPAGSFGMFSAHGGGKKDKTASQCYNAATR